MGFLNDKQLDALLSGMYICRKCGGKMEFEDEWEDTLVCPKCGASIDSDMYGIESEEEYEALYPTEEEILGYSEEEYEDDEEDTGEYYEEECGELSDD